jgi:hypothetical protein
VAKKHGLEIEFIKKKNFRKEQRIRSIVEQRGDAPIYTGRVFDLPCCI